MTAVIGTCVEGGRPASHPAVLRRLLKRPGVRVLHAYGLDPTGDSGSERDALVERLAKCLAGEASPHSVFWTAESATKLARSCS
jgi:hypothetical protein